ncbi:MAG: MvaI/BcnI restriction endonuclease family protein [Bacteroidetes bacterium]|nr:MvaI/BcnI restriction endonuclease family protein [Bacteroidota bacterium]
MTKKETIKKDFHKIKELGFVECTRPNNRDGGIGNTYEDLLGVQENNLKEPDYLGYEIKSKREYNSSYISLFSKAPSYPKGANSYLRETFGEIRDPNHPEKKKLYASVFGHRYSIVYQKYKMKLKVDRENKKLFLIIKDLEDNFMESVYWTFEHLKKASIKMKSLKLVLAETKKENNIIKYHFNKAELYENFLFDNLLENIENGGIMFDIRIGVHNSGKNFGKTHDHGSGFRVKRENFKNLYESFEEI